MPIIARPIANDPSVLRDSIYNAYKGLDLTSSITNMDPSCLRVANNTDILISGALQTRAGNVNTLSGSVWANRKIQNGLEFQVDDTTTQNLVAGVQVGVGTGEFGLATTSVASIKSGMNNQRPSLIQFSNLIFYFNGYDDFLYDGVVTRQIGIDPPTNAPTDNGDIPGDLLIGATYVWAYTYYNSVTGAESSPSPLSAQIVIGAGGGRDLNVTPGDPLTADTIRLYRVTANGVILFLDTTAAIGATTISSTNSDAGIVVSPELELDNTRPSVWGDTPYAVSSNNRIFVTGFVSPNENRVRFSKIGQSGPLPESYQAISFADCISNVGLGDVNIGLGTAFQSTMVLKKNSIGRLDNFGAQTQEIGVDNVIFQYNEISRGVSGISHWAITNVYNNMLWLGRDNIYMTDSTNVVPVGNRIANFLKTLQWENASKLSAINDVKNRKVMFTAITGSSIEPNLVIVGNYKDFPEFYWTLYVQGPVTATYPGIQAGSFWTVTQSDGSKDIYFGNSTFNGKLYHQGIGTNDDGSAIYWGVEDYPTSYGLSEEQKLFYKDILFVQGSGSAYSLNISSVFDLGDDQEEVSSQSLLNATSLWDSAIWDVATWASEGPLRLEHGGHRKAYFKQLYLSTTGIDQPVTVFGWTKIARNSFLK